MKLGPLASSNTENRWCLVQVHWPINEFGIAEKGRRNKVSTTFVVFAKQQVKFEGRKGLEWKDEK